MFLKYLSYSMSNERFSFLALYPLSYYPLKNNVLCFISPLKPHLGREEVKDLNRSVVRDLCCSDNSAMTVLLVFLVITHCSGISFPWKYLPSLLPHESWFIEEKNQSIRWLFSKYSLTYIIIILQRPYITNPLITRTTFCKLFPLESTISYGAL